jgi:hypothetical protein
MNYSELYVDYCRRRLHWKSIDDVQSDASERSGLVPKEG